MKLSRPAALVLGFAALLLLFAGCAYVPAPSDAEPFAFEELAHLFTLTDDEILDRWGEPDREIVTDYMGLLASEFLYGKNVYRTEATSGYAYYACIYDDAVPAPREIRVGMKVGDAAARFASSGGGTLYDDGSGSRYRLLYGDYLEGDSYGVLFYENGKPKLLEYASQGCVFACGIRGGKVEYMEYYLK